MTVEVPDGATEVFAVVHGRIVTLTNGEWMRANAEAKKQLKVEFASELAVTAIKRLNELTGRVFKPEIRRAELEARIDEYGLPSVVLVIESKVQEWSHDTAMAKFLRPETLFRRTKFEAYLATATPITSQPISNTPQRPPVPTTYEEQQAWDEWHRNHG